MRQCQDVLCQNRTSSGYCMFTVCTNPYGTKEKSISYVTSNIDYTEMLVFPQTIGDITYYSKKELIKWVEDQQKINKDHNYGIGNWC